LPIPGNTSVSFLEARKIFSKACFVCHQAWSSLDEQGFIGLVADNQKLNPLIVPGNASLSFMAIKMNHNLTVLGSGQGVKMPVAGGGYSLTKSDYDIVASWINGIKVTGPYSLSFKGKSVESSKPIFFGSVVANPKGSTGELIVKNNSTNTLRINLKFEKGVNFKFEAGSNVSLAIPPLKTSKVLVRFTPDGIESYQDNVTITESSKVQSFQITGSGNDTLTSYGLSCSPGNPDYYRYFSLPRYVHLMNTFKNILFPRSYNLIAADSAFKSILNNFPKLTVKEYASANYGGFNAYTAKVYVDLIDRLATLISENNIIFATAMQDVGGPCLNLLAINEMNPSCAAYIMDEVSLTTFGRRTEAQKLDFLRFHVSEAFKLNDKSSVIYMMYFALLNTPEFFDFDGGSDLIAGSVYRTSTPGMIRNLSRIIIGSSPPAALVKFVETLNNDLSTSFNRQKVVDYLYSLKDMNGNFLAVQQVVNLLAEYFRLDKARGTPSASSFVKGLLAEYADKGVNVASTNTGTLGGDATKADYLLLKILVEGGSKVEELIATKKIVTLNDLQRSVAATTSITEQVQLLAEGRGGIMFGFSNTLVSGDSFYNNPFSTFGSYFSDVFFNIKIKPANLSLDDLAPPFPDPTKNIRTRYAEKVASPSCTTCHEQFNFISDAASSFNGVGEMKSIETHFDNNGQKTVELPVDTYTTFKWKGLEEVIDGPNELVEVSNRLGLIHLSLSRLVSMIVANSADEALTACSISDSYQYLINQDASLKHIFGFITNQRDVLMKKFDTR